MQQTKRSLLGLLISLIVHSIVVGLILWSWNKPSDSANSAPGDISTSISMEMVQGMVMEEPAPARKCTKRARTRKTRGCGRSNGKT